MMSCTCIFCGRINCSLSQIQQGSSAFLVAKVGKNTKKLPKEKIEELSNIVETIIKQRHKLDISQRELA